MWRSIASNGISLLIVLTLLLGGAIIYGKREYRAEGPLREAICVRVAPGETMRGVSADLQEQGAVKSGALMRVGAEYTEKADDLKAGAFLVPAEP